MTIWTMNRKREFISSNPHAFQAAVVNSLNKFTGKLY